MRLSGITGLFVKSEPGSVFLISIIIWEIFVSVKICVISVCGILKKKGIGVKRNVPENVSSNYSTGNRTA